MMTQLITSDEQLRRYLPNAFATARGEAPFYNKVLPWLQTAERWLFMQFIGDDFADALIDMEDDEPLKMTTCSVVAHEALMRAVPSLRDIVDFMRKHDAQFPEFRHSATYKLFEPPIFENKKKASGYFSNSQRVERSE